MLSILRRLSPKTATQHQCSGGGFTRNLGSWASAIRNASSPQQALRLYSLMQQHAIPFDSYSILFTLKSSSHLKNLSLIRHLHAHLFKIGFTPHIYVATSLLHAYLLSSSSSTQDARRLFDEMPQRNSVTFNTMITGYFKSGDVNNARLLFDNMPDKDVASWSATIAGYMGSGNWERGLTLFREMMGNQSVQPDLFTCGSVLSMCSNMGSTGLLVGESVHGFVEKSFGELDVQSGTALIDMYAKCGLLKSVFLIFEGMKEKNVMTWSAMICGLAQHGYGEKALYMFDKMKEEGVRPNEITFTGVFTACTHTGLVMEGVEHFKDMVEVYGLEPRIQHYGCMVDLLGKSGRLEEAYEVIESMKIEPNVVVWGSFLAACRVHKQFEMAEKVVQKVLKVIKPERDGGVYTLISDLYALGGKWDEAKRMRDTMTNLNVKKIRGSSFVTRGTSCL